MKQQTNMKSEKPRNTPIPPILTKAPALNKGGEGEITSSKHLAHRIGIAPKTTETALRAIIFAVHDRWFALPVGAVLKISLCPPIKNALTQGMGTIDLGTETATVIDLEAKFAPNREYSFARRYLILTQTHDGEKCGLIAQSPPAMIEIPLSTIRPLPASYQQQGNLSFISHLAVLPKVGEDETIDVFLLGARQLLSARQTTVQSPQPSWQQQFMRISLQRFHVLLPVGYVVKAIPFNPSALLAQSQPSQGILGDYPWQGNTIKLLDLNQLLGDASLLQEPTKTLTIVIVRQPENYIGLLAKAVRQLEWHDLRSLQSIDDNFFLQGQFDSETFLLNLSAIDPI